MRGQGIRYFRYFKSYVAVLATALLLCLAVLPCGVSGAEYRPEYRSGDVVAGNDISVIGMAQAMFHQQTLAETDDESYALAFPGASQPGSGDFALPTLAQTSAETVSATDTGFFHSNVLFTPVQNRGAAPVGVGYPGIPAPVTTARFSGKSLLYPEMVVRGNLLGKGDLGPLLRTGYSFPPAQAVTANATIWKLGKLQSEQGATGLNASDKGLPVILSAHNFDYVSTPARINNTSIIERMWRNTHQGSVMDFLYEGDAAYPEWIVPLKNPLLLLDCGNPFEANKHGLNMTRPGSLLTRTFWAL